MSNNNQLSHNELIEETFLKDATPSDIVNWLKDHCGSLNDFKNRNFNPYYFSNLRKIYETKWINEDNPKLKLAVCLYGKNEEVLRETFFSDCPPHFKSAILKNALFVNRIQPFETDGLSSLSPAEIMDLYNKKKEINEDTLFNKIFLNPWLKLSFVLSVFEREKPFNKIVKSDLLILLELMFLNRKSVNFFEIKRHGFEYESSKLVHKIIDLMLNVNLENDPSILYLFENFLSVVKKNNFVERINISHSKLEKFFATSSDYSKNISPEIIMMDHDTILSIRELIEPSIKNEDKINEITEITNLSKNLDRIVEQNKVLLEQNQEYEQKFLKIESEFWNLKHDQHHMHIGKFDNLIKKVDYMNAELRRDLEHLNEKLKEPNDIFSKILLNIPVLNRLFRILIR